MLLFVWVNLCEASALRGATPACAPLMGAGSWPPPSRSCRRAVPPWTFLLTRAGTPRSLNSQCSRVLLVDERKAETMHRHRG